MTSALAPTINLKITQGQDFSQVYSWYSDVMVWKAIQSISKGGPCVIGCTGHGMVAGQPFWVAGASGMSQINRDPASEEPYFATIDSANAVSINDLSSWDFGTHLANTGSIVYPTPRDLTGYTARAMFRTSVGAEDPPLISLTSPADIVIDNVAKTIELKIANAVTEALEVLSMYYDLEMVSAGGIVTPIARGNVAVVREATR